MGIAVGWHTTIADDFDANLEAFRIAAGRAGLVLATGGLGPTQDDLTREVPARAAGVELEFHPQLFEQIEQMFRRRICHAPPVSRPVLSNPWGERTWKHWRRTPGKKAWPTRCRAATCRPGGTMPGPWSSFRLASGETCVTAQRRHRGRLCGTCRKKNAAWKEKNGAMDCTAPVR